MFSLGFCLWSQHPPHDTGSLGARAGGSFRSHVRSNHKYTLAEKALEPSSKYSAFCLKPFLCWGPDASERPLWLFPHAVCSNSHSHSHAHTHLHTRPRLHAHIAPSHSQVHSIPPVRAMTHTCTGTHVLACAREHKHPQTGPNFADQPNPPQEFSPTPAWLRKILSTSLCP